MTCFFISLGHLYLRDFFISFKGKNTQKIRPKERRVSDPQWSNHNKKHTKKNICVRLSELPPSLPQWSMVKCVERARRVDKDGPACYCKLCSQTQLNKPDPGAYLRIGFVAKVNCRPVMDITSD